jgi:small-conductance mechanosensitive channel
MAAFDPFLPLGASDEDKKRWEKRLKKIAEQHRPIQNDEERIDRSRDALRRSQQTLRETNPDDDWPALRSRNPSKL